MTKIRNERIDITTNFMEIKFNAKPRSNTYRGNQIEIQALKDTVIEKKINQRGSTMDYMTIIIRPNNCKTI